MWNKYLAGQLSAARSISYFDFAYSLKWLHNVCFVSGTAVTWRLSCSPCIPCSVVFFCRIIATLSRCKSSIMWLVSVLYSPTWIMSQQCIQSAQSKRQMDGSERRFKYRSWRHRCTAQHAYSHKDEPEEARNAQAPTHTETTNTHIHPPFSLVLQTTTDIHTHEWWNRLWLTLPPVNPSDTGLPPFPCSSNNGGLTWTLLRAFRSLQQIKDNLHIIHAVVFIPFCCRLDYYCSPL